MPWALVVDAVVAVLLVATIAYAVVLNRKLSQLRHNKEELIKLIATFNEAMARADTGVQRLRKTSVETGRSLQEQLERAQAVRDDLAYMVERGDNIANRLEAGVRTARAMDGYTPPPEPAPPANSETESPPALPGGGRPGSPAAAAREILAAAEDPESGATSSMLSRLVREAADEAGRNDSPEPAPREAVSRDSAARDAGTEEPRRPPRRPSSLADRLRPETEDGDQAPYKSEELGERSATEQELLRALQSSR